MRAPGTGALSSARGVVGEQDSSMDTDDTQHELPTGSMTAPREDIPDDRLLYTLERLLEIESASVDDALDQVTQLVADALHAEKVDAFLLEGTVQTLVARGTSDTPLGRKQRALGLDRLSVANGGRTVQVFQSGATFLGGHGEQDTEELVGIREGLGIRSQAAVPVPMGAAARGVLIATDTRPDVFSERDLRFLEAVARWVGMVARRAELIEQVAEQAREQGRRMAAEELVTVVAHDLRNYLTPLKARIDLIARRAERRRQRRDVADAEIAARELDRLSRMIANLLDVGRIEQGVLALTLQPVDLTELAQETAEALSAPGSRIEVLAPEELIAIADLERIRQALENLVANALRHSPENQPVTVTVAQERWHGAVGRDVEWCTISVSDSGPGIAPEVLPRLFSRFAPGPGSPGLGLGLYLAYQIARTHGGTLSVDSIPGQGATFVLRLPVAGPNL